MAADLPSLKAIPLDEIKEAAIRIRGHVIRTPLLPLNQSIHGAQVYLKLENLQPTGSFKQRGACNALHCLSPDQVGQGVYTSSAGNFAQGVAYAASQLGIPSTIIVPDNAPEVKVSAIKRLGGDVVKVSYDRWWGVMVTHQYDGLPGSFIHPVCNREVIAGNGTVGLEILEDLPDVDVVVMPFGGGGLSSGVASAVKALKPDTKIIACEVATAAPLTASREANRPTSVSNHKSSFVDGMGGKSVFPEMWSLVSNLIDDVVVLSLEEVAEAVRTLLERNHLLAEGAGAAPVAAATSGKCGGGKIVAVVSGGNIDKNKLVQILSGSIPD